MIADADLLPGQIFAAEFRVVSLLAEGGMGTVYVVEQISTGKRRALKLMLPQAAEFDGERRFQQEARASSMIPSEHVVDVIAAGVETRSRTPWLVMELLEGECLDHLLDRRDVLSASECFDILEQLSHALSAAHDLGVVHRDLKPENIFLAHSRSSESRYFVKVLDYGMAKLLHIDPKNTAAMGSPLWMAPEQTQTGANISCATDIWAFGLLAFRMLTGRHYWRSDGGSVGSLLREIAVEPLISASERAALLGAEAPPAGFDRWFSRCVCRDSAARYQHGADAWRELAKILAPLTPQGISQHQRRTRRYVFGAIFAFLTLLCLSIAFALTRAHTAAPRSVRHIVPATQPLGVPDAPPASSFQLPIITPLGTSNVTESISSSDSPQRSRKFPTSVTPRKLHTHALPTPSASTTSINSTHSTIPPDLL